MRDSELNGAERRLQPAFIKWLIRLAFFTAPILLLQGSSEHDRPNRLPRSPAEAVISAIALPLPEGGLRLGGLWELRSKEPRFGGLSALAWDAGRLVAVTDNGVVIDWRPPGGTARFRDLPDGPGPADRKIYRDAEALSRDSLGRGWWVTFEQFHGAWLFDPGFTRALAVRPVRLRTAWRNWGIEGAVSLRGGLLLLPEDGGEAVLIRDGREERHALRVDGSIADAVALPSGSIVVAERQLRPWGMRNRIGWLEGAADHRVRAWGKLPLGRWDNIEGLAIEPRPDGRHRLWFVTDNDFDRRTLIGWLPLPPPARR